MHLTMDELVRPVCGKHGIFRLLRVILAAQRQH